MKSCPNPPNMDGITIGRLRYLYEVVTQGGVRKAAERLDVAPSSVSRQLAQLEYVARAPLLEPGRRAIKPTEVGKLLLDYYAECIARKEILAARLTNLHDSGDDQVAIGIVQGLASELMQDTLCRLRDVHPGTTVSLRLGGMDDILRWLVEDQIHLGITYGPPPDIRADELMETMTVIQPMCAIVPPEHGLTCRKEVTIDDMLPYGFALSGPAYGTRKIIMEIERERSCTFQVRLETNHLLGLQNFVIAQLGITVLPRFAVRCDLDLGRLVALPIAHPLARHARIQMFVRRGRQLPDSAQTLERLLTHQLNAWHRER